VISIQLNLSYDSTVLFITAQPAADIILHLSTDNWAALSQAFMQQCFAKFCLLGQKMLFNLIVPILLISVSTSKKFLDMNEN
jgi:hypothetical protein